jgi:ribonuclease BN (tRNA processing enzyme)
LIDGRIVLDLPPTAIPQLHRMGVDTRDLDVFFISHHHADHSFGLPFLLLEYCVRIEREKPLYIVGPPGIEERTHDTCELAWPDMRDAGFKPRVPLRFVEIEREGEYRAGDLLFSAIPMAHFDLDALGFRFEYKGRTFAYTGDTGECDHVRQLLRGVDVAIIELTHPAPTKDPGHLDIEEFRQLTAELRSRGAFVLATHMSATPPATDGITICEDGAVFYV